MSYPILQSSFYARDTVVVAQELLGMLLVRTVGDVTVSGIIVETEAYCFEDDPASHAYTGPKIRNAAMFGAVGHAYVYVSYGVHFCFNLVAKQKGVSAGAVLIRAVEPVEGIEVMQKNRGIHTVSTLTDGPGKLTQALAITKEHNGRDCMQESLLYVQEYKDTNRSSIEISKRIGISKGVDKLWRFCL